MPKKTKKSISFIRIFIVISIIFVGVLILISSQAATPTANLEVETGTPTGSATKFTNVAGASATGYVKFVSAAAPVYCGGRSFVAPAHCIGAAEWATSMCSTTAQCQATGFKCYAYMNSDKTKVYNLSLFGGNHSGGKNEILNPALCGKDIWSVIKGTVPDFDNGNVPQNSKHVAVQNRTQSTFNTTLTGNEYDPAKP